MIRDNYVISTEVGGGMVPAQARQAVRCGFDSRRFQLPRKRRGAAATGLTLSLAENPRHGVYSGRRACVGTIHSGVVFFLLRQRGGLSREQAHATGPPKIKTRWATTPEARNRVTALHAWRRMVPSIVKRTPPEENSFRIHLSTRNDWP